MAADPLGWGTARETFFKALRMTDPSSAPVQQFAQRLASSGTALIPTLSVTLAQETLDTLSPDDPVLRILGLVREGRGNATERPPIAAASKDDLLTIERVFVKAGVHYLTGAGDRLGQVAGRSLHTELRLLVKIGLSPRQALAAATGNFDSVSGWNEVGNIKAGFLADLLILNANPLVEISNTHKIHALYFDGARVDREGMVPARRN